ncbi:hypothetical protein DXG03_009623 [Asterophora parasitica]|uniref:Enoyl reductase (ER) domain-containing protein n=1 Tax=Asterophora parasitica TaxID=117018 RepID=A0A9P7KCE9_9AGAR|nr:hypothetical protein DXG03_009623 [Asterophora parasitica]
MSEIPSTQKAWIEERRGSPAESLRLRTDWPVPTTLKPGEVLIKVQACGLNPAGYKIMGLFPNFLRGRPLPSGMDFSGVVVDANGTEYSNRLCKSTKQGTLSEYVRLPTSHIVPRPSTITPLAAAGLATVYLTAYTALVELAQVEAGQTVFVYGGSSGVGLAAIQTAKARGARVISSASGKNEAFVRGIGADEFIDYTKEPIHKHLLAHPPSPKFNVIFDAIGISDPSLYTSSSAYLAPNGVFVSSGPFPKDASAPELWNLAKTVAAISTPRWLGGTPRRWTVVTDLYSREKLEAVHALVAQGLLNPPIDSVFEFKDVVPGYERQMTKRATGKIIVKIDPSVD